MLIANRYEATGNAAWGGMSEVHEFIDTHLDRKVMLKRVKRSADASRLLDEQKALLALRAKHVVELLDIVKFEILGTTETGLILEKIEGRDLRESSFQFDRPYLNTIWQIAAGLADIHAAGVIHRDIKPGNIRRDEMGVIKIFDFGLSRQDGVDDKTRSIAGTDGYMAPELHSDRTIGFSNAIDVFAYGQTALSLLDGSRTGVDDASVRCAKLLAQAPHELRLAIEACCSDMPTDRPSMREICDILSRTLLHDEHRANFYHGQKSYHLDKNKRSISLRTNAGSISLQYNGDKMLVAAVTGNVSINNIALVPGSHIQSSGVIIFRPSGTGYPACVAYDLSNPQVDI